MENLKTYCLCFCMIFCNSVYAAEHQIKMLSSSDGKMMVFEPAVLKINKGDSVKWIATQPGHNSASINEMLPDDTKGWEGAVNEEISINFDIEGV